MADFTFTVAEGLADTYANAIVPTGPTLVSTTQTAFGNSTSPKDTASFNVTNGDLLTLSMGSERWDVFCDTPTKQSGTATIGTVTLHQDAAAGSGNVSRATIWSAPVTGSGTLVMRFNRAAGSGFAGWYGGVARVWSGHNGIGTSNKGTNATSSASTVTLTGVSANSAIDMLQTDWVGGATTGKTYRTADAGTFTETLASQMTQFTTYHGTYNSAGSAGNKDVGMSAPNQQWANVAAEILGVSTKAFILVPVDVGSTSDATIKAFTTLSAVLGGGVTERTTGGWSRKSITSGITVTFLSTPNRYAVDFGDQTWSTVTSGNVTDLLLCYDSDTTTGTDSNIVPVAMFDCPVTPDGTDVIVQLNSSGLVWAT